MRKLTMFAAISAVAPLFLSAGMSSAATIASVYSGGPGSYTLTGTVTSILSTSSTYNTITLADGTASILVYRALKTAYGSPAVGDNVTLTAADTTYQGSPELSSPAVGAVTVNSSGNAVVIPTLTIPQFNATGDGTANAIPPYAEAVVTLDNVYLTTPPATLATGTLYTLNDGLGDSTTLYGYAADTAVAAAISGANTTQTASGGTFLSGPLDITGFVDVYYGKPEFYPLSITAGVAVPEPASLGMLAVSAIGLLARRRRV